MPNERMRAYGAQKSEIREIFAYALERKAQIGADKVFDFSIGNPSVPAPDAVRESIERALELPPAELHGYSPANGLPEARQAVAASLNRRFGTSYAADDLYLTAGAAASLSISINAVCNEGDEVVVIAPYFPEYRVWIESAGCVCVEVLACPGTFQIDVDAVAAALGPRTRAVIVNSPNNPTGAVYARECLERLAAALRAAGERFGSPVYLISDEPYREITYGAEVPWVPDVYEHTIVCYSYSKSLSLPGERIGWILVPGTMPGGSDVMCAVAGAGRALGFVCAPVLFQRVIADCVDEPSDVAAYARNREVLSRGLSEAGYEYVEPDGAFYLWVRALEPDARAFCERARSFELLPVASDGFGVPGWVRVGYCVAHETIVNSLPAWKALAESYRQP